MLDLTTLSADQIKQLIADATAELSRREAATAVPVVMHTIRIERGVYNQRRLGKPYIATATFDDAGKSTFNFGTTIGLYNGDAGELTIKAQSGDVVVVGQKDFKRADYSEQTWHIVQADGSLKEYDNKLDVIKAMQEGK